MFIFARNPRAELICVPVVPKHASSRARKLSRPNVRTPIAPNAKMSGRWLLVSKIVFINGNTMYIATSASKNQKCPIG